MDVAGSRGLTGPCGEVGRTYHWTSTLMAVGVSFLFAGFLYMIYGTEINV